ncbi:hypothetical protein [Roseomonas genomospecies 6]|uniref:DUF4164 family protein n=1 Tax=Roseomonas genomospecies 6 TaxID=214106 RepID=A0A9W7NHW1_9PROT|nr:hypothetical protein [Roseomonas genomospecies 6]KAA0679202.1 hypothetical protein DS843_16975 [Roseomonas genomospecies 6]
MDKSDLILAAIEQLGRNLDAKIEGVRAELKGDIAQVNAGLARLETEVKTENRVIHARLDEQRQTVNALIPQRIAAVGRTDAAE